MRSDRDDATDADLVAEAPDRVTETMAQATARLRAQAWMIAPMTTLVRDDSGDTRHSRRLASWLRRSDD